MRHPRMKDTRIMDPSIVGPRIMGPRIEYPRIVHPRIVDPRIKDPRIEDPVHGLKYCHENITFSGFKWSFCKPDNHNLYKRPNEKLCLHFTTLSPNVWA